ncbi:ABC transporter substrate-binding protein [Litoreibacter arenae]|uniref:Various polyols ABC transporter, periplasmic substrate-binding protein n=1 Tax=Litoreibacter arenae DSM 19593 TaxID=1123360 RepID=S9RTS9_9RHOB|nr:sugar ABC transporter substrate-binding protein [Litoreibacter arenae]EPX77374.1 Various polyols ABC transporter, periplasmic substrate-binding protein [Litoreibacter arenae DSM 19593]
MKSLRNTALGLAVGVAGASTAFAGELTIATVNNGHMIEMQKLTPEFEAAHPGTTLNWVTLDEGTLRSRVTTDITTKGGQFDVMTIGMYEAPIWGSRGWLQPLEFDAEYDVEDILPAMRGGLSHEGKLYAAPFYGESSMIMYRKDLVEEAGMTIEDNPTWDHIREVAKAITNKDEGVYGICLRGKPGWGDNMAFLTTMANSFGAQWFNEDWTPALDSDAWQEAVTFYVEMLEESGPPGSEGNSFNEILALMNEGKCGMWIDATIAASFVTDPDQSKVADKMAFAQAPQKATTKGANWLWAWSLAIPAGTDQAEEAMDFIEWATSKSYIELVAEKNGWGNVPTGTRQSTYDNPNFQEAATFDEAELKAILSANPEDSTLNPSPYVGVQFAAIPEFQAIGTAVGQQMTDALAGNITVEEALENSQAIADREMKKAGYY